MNASSVAVVIISLVQESEDQESYRIAGPNIFSPKLLLDIALFQVSYYEKSNTCFLFKTYIIVDSIIRNKILPNNIIGLIEAQLYCIILLFLC